MFPIVWLIWLLDASSGWLIWHLRSSSNMQQLLLIARTGRGFSTRIILMAGWFRMKGRGEYGTWWAHLKTLELDSNIFCFLCWLNRCSIFSSVVLLRLGDKWWKNQSVWFWRERDLNPGPSASYTDALPLDHDVLPSFEVSLWVLTHGITQKLCKITLIWNVALSHIWHSAQNLLQNKYKCTKCCWSKCLK